jgi:hypothetical protein
MGSRASALPYFFALPIPTKRQQAKNYFDNNRNPASFEAALNTLRLLP